MTTTRLSRPEDLRTVAEDRLRSGTAPSSGGWSIGAGALSLLYRLASDPERSADALKLLHELQTHQVELDLQNAQLLENEREMALQIDHFQCVYDHAPAAYLVLGLDGCLLQSNRRASQLFGLEAHQLRDHPLTSLLSLDSRPVIHEVLASAAAREEIAAVRVRTLDARRLVMLSSLAPAQDAVLVLMYAEEQA